MIFVDANVPMYLVGEEHPHRSDARRVVQQAVADGERLMTSAEVFQEILHRYRAIARLDAVQPAFDVLHGLIDEILPIDIQDVEFAKTTLLERPSISSRDALHVALMRRHGVRRILSFDSGFDAVPGIERLA